MMLAKSERVNANRQGRQNNHIKQVAKTNLKVVVPIGPIVSKSDFAKDVPMQREKMDRISAKTPSDVGY